MKRKREITLPKYCLAEELINSISHGIGGGLAIAALVLCVVKSSTPQAVVSCAIYGSLMILLYIISCIYHALSPNLKAKKVLRVMDHCNVMLMVAGTYMPICLSLLWGNLGWILFSIVWVVTILAVVFNAIDVDKYQFLSVLCNLVLGWGILVLFNPLKEVCPLCGILWLFLGGVIYTLGSILYGIGNKKPFFHSVFHFFVLGGSICHFFFIYFYCI